MSRRHASQEPDDEVMPYSDDETDDELDASTEDEEEEPPGAPQPPTGPQISGEPRPLVHRRSIWARRLRGTCLSEMAWKVKANDRPYHHLPEFQKKVFLCIKKSRYSVRNGPWATLGPTGLLTRPLRNGIVYIFINNLTSINF